MNLELDERDQLFRKEIRGFLAERLTPELAEGGRSATSVFCDPAYSLPWQRILHSRGWAGASWPAEHGGPGWSEQQQYIFAEECALAGAPTLAPMGLRMVGPCIMRYGTAEQRAYFLPRILSGEDYWCQGYSEPGAGSDLASLRMRAESDGDDYVLNGSKIWTTHAHFANWMFCLVRTRADGKPQTGITFLLVSMKAPGVNVRPIINLAGDHEFNEVFFSDVRTPKAQRLGEENDGWSVAKYLLEFERGGCYSPALRARLRQLRALLSERESEGPNAELSMRLARLEITVDALHVTEHRLLGAQASGQNPGPLSSLLKTRGTELLQAVEELGLDMAAECGGAPSASSGNAPKTLFADAAARYLNSRSASIYGGSNEIQRNIMARLVLGL